MIRSPLRGIAVWLVCVAGSGSVLLGCVSTSTPNPSVERRGTAAPDPQEAERRAQVRLQLASAYYSQGQYDTALEEVRRSLASIPNHAPAYNLRGLIHAALGDERQAEESFQRALQINGRDADALHNYGWFLCQRQRFADAVGQFNQALAQPQYRDAPRTYAARGVCQARAGQWLEAEASLMRSYELDPANPGTALNLSDVLLRRGELTRARFYIGRVNAVPDNTNAQTLWLAARIEHKLGNPMGVREYGERMRARFPQAPELVLLDRGRFDE
ncbi:type IV pilus biogenesis/stability protein PilW [Aquincola sp. S2]|uniref:Type IV pilus biogenesis/stability protein PilW n=1 Tax=Pseudaquabacterium terrae TaxID=2732868 RepID=A0ABX2EIZ2_9BURK|nr:type IV pilus biogenesis/stability protein PilW [Aquabacterium terrae]NRF68607.1 type IV pilus biogenesis/stability protein PilW [Aquabacterium terrae]